MSEIEERKAEPVAWQKPEDVVENRPEWIWYCESTSGVPVVTFGRWPKHPQQVRYKLAEIQPTEHDHPTPPAVADAVTAEQASNELARREEAGVDARVSLIAPANVASLTNEQLKDIAAKERALSASPSPVDSRELIERLVKALEEIAASRRMNCHEMSDEERAEYWSALALRYRSIASKALAAKEQQP